MLSWSCLFNILASNRFRFCTRNSCAQLGAPTGSVPNLNHHSIALELARCAHIRFDLCARIEIFVSCHNFRGSGSTTCRSFPQTYPRFFLRFDRFRERIYNARAVTGVTKLHPVHRTASEISIYSIYSTDKTCQNPYMVQTGKHFGNAPLGRIQPDTAYLLQKKNKGKW